MNEKEWKEIDEKIKANLGLYKSDDEFSIQLHYKKRYTYFRFYFPFWLYGIISRFFPVYEEYIDCIIEKS